MKILLTAQNTTFKIDQEDYEWVNKWTWHISNTWGYISRPQRFNGIQSTISLHIEILKRMGFNMSNTEGDHIDRDITNNCRNNLRPVTRSQNLLNRKLQSNNTTGYRNVSYNFRRGKYYARIHITKNGKYKFLGYFNTVEEAALAYNKAAIIYHGEFAVLNEV